MPKQIELHQAFVFDCEECGKENLVRIIAKDFDQDEIDEIKWQHGIEPDEAGQFHMMPTMVECWNCNEKFSTTEE